MDNPLPIHDHGLPTHYVQAEKEILAVLTPDKQLELRTQIFLPDLKELQFLRWLRFDVRTIRDLMAAVQEAVFPPGHLVFATQTDVKHVLYLTSGTVSIEDDDAVEKTHRQQVCLAARSNCKV